MKKKTAAVATSVAAIAVCSSIIAGSTFALFTSESQTNIVVKSATVDVSARIDDIVAKHFDYNTQTNEYEMKDGLFSGNSVAEVEGVLSLNEVAPGDLVTFNIYVENHSTIDVKYRVKMVLEGAELLNALEFTVGDEDFSGVVSYVSEWKNWEKDEVIPVRISLPEKLGNEYQNMSCKISYTVEAVQGNGAVNNDEAHKLTTKVATAAELEEALDYFATRSGTIQLLDSIKLDNYVGTVSKDLTIDLNGNTLSGEHITIWEGAGKNAAGNLFISNAESHLTIKNGTLDIYGDNSYTLCVYGGLTFDGVTSKNMQAKSAINVYKAARVDILNSTVTAGDFVVATNASNQTKNSPAPTINIVNSTLGGAGIKCPILFNVNGKLNVKDSTLSGDWQAAVVRGGTATFDNCTLNKLSVGGGRTTEEWKDGVYVEAAALTVGNKMKTDADTTYQYPSNVTLIDTAVTAPDGCYTVYAYGNNAEENGATLTYDASIGDVVVGGGCVTKNVTYVVTPENIEEYLSGKNGSLSNATLKLTPGNYGKIVLGLPDKYAGSDTAYICSTDKHETQTFTDAEEFIKHLATSWHGTPHYTRTIENLTILGQEGVTVEGLVASSGHCNGDNIFDPVRGTVASGSRYYMAHNFSNITFKGVSFTSQVNIATSSADTVIDGVTFDSCNFTTGGTAAVNAAALRYYNESNNGNVRNLTVVNCNFVNSYQGIYTSKIVGVKVDGCTFDTTGHNAIAIQSAEEAVNHKAIVITNNTFNSVGDRIIRLNNVGADTQITIKGNVATNSGDSDGQVIKAGSLADGITYDVSGNDWGEGKVVANAELQDK